jgi:hypothetical protein
MRNPSQGEVSRRTAFIRNNGECGRDAELHDHLEPVCTLGCPVPPSGPVFEGRKKVIEKNAGGQEVTIIPTQPAGFGCPCHGGQYDTEGNRTAGPPVRALGPYEFSIVKGTTRAARAGTAWRRSTRRRRGEIIATRSTDPASTSTASSPGSIRFSRRADGDDAAKEKGRAALVQVANYPVDWLEERSASSGGVKYFLFRKVPSDISWYHTLGSATLTAFLVQAIDRRDPRDVLQAGPEQRLRVDPAHHERPDARLARTRDAPLGRERVHHPDVLPHGARASCSARTSIRAS